ncbi:MAG: hypothetical protein Q9169_002334 [Polycauliona sp. 2 TL-2023]
MSDTQSQPHAAYIEDYNEDAHTTMPETRQTANVAAKRSKPDISRIKVTDLARDEASDSGYSSHTAATLTSGDSSLVSKAGSATLTMDTSVESLAAAKRRPLLVEKQSHSTPQSPQKQSLRRTASKARPKEKLRQDPCDCDNCRRKETVKGNRPAQTSPSKESKQPRPQLRPAVTTNAPASKEPMPSVQRSSSNAAVVQPAQPRPRTTGTSSYRANPRPVSFHGGVVTQPMFYAPMNPGRPPATFAVPSPFPPPSYPPPTTSYFSPPYQHPPQPPQPPPQHMQREAYPLAPLPYNIPAQPQSRQWHMEQRLPPPQQHPAYSAPPILDYPHALQYSGSAPSSHPTMHRTFSERDRERPMPLREEYFPSDQFDEDYYRMPPPPPPPPKVSRATPVQQRPAIRHAATTAARVPQHERYIVEEEPVPRSPRKYDEEGYERLRRPSLASRPSHTSGNARTYNVDQLDHQFSRMSVEGSSAAAKQRRRMTYYGGQPSRDLEGQVEAYQAQRNAHSESAAIPLTADSLKLVRHKTQTSNSDTGSRASGEGRGSRGSSDIKPRSATGRRSSTEIKPRNNETDGFTMRFDPSHNVNVDVKGGGAKGQTISFRQSKEGDGNIELSIGANKSDAKEKSRRRQSYIDGAGVKELEYVRTASRMGRSSGKTDTERGKERSVAPSRSRRSSKSRGALME